MKKRFDAWCIRMDENLKNFEWKYLLFPFSKEPKNEIRNLIQIKSTKNMSHMEMLYGTNISKGTNFALDMIKVAIKKEICDEIMNGNLIEWISQDTQNGTQITGRIIVKKF